MDRKAKRELTSNGEGDQMPSWREVFIYFLMLGFINIGGAVAQITMMYNFQAFLAGASAAVVGVIIENQ